MSETHPFPFLDSYLRDPAHGPLPGMLVLLTVATGVVDAVSILALGRVFVANMTGNIVFIGFALAGAPGFSLAASVVALAGFLAGAWLGGQAVARYGPRRGVLLRDVVAVGNVAVAVRRVLSVLAMLVGALGGALLVLHTDAAAALSLATGLVTVVCAAAAAASRRPADWQFAKR